MNKSMHILYLVPHVPNPTKIRSHFQIRGLLDAGHQVTVVTLNRSASDAKHIKRLEQSGVKVIWVSLPRLKSAFNSMIVLPTHKPLQSRFMWSSDLMQKITEVVGLNPPDVVHVEHLRMADYGLQLVKHWPTVWDAVDYLATLYEQAVISSTSRVLRWIASLEAPRLATYERWLTGQFPATLVISERDWNLFREYNPYSSQVHLLPQGLPIYSLSKPVDRYQNKLIITGTLNYHPNVASVQYFVNEIFPLIRHHYPSTELQLVGSNPASTIQSMHSPNIEVTGFVPSVTDYLERATIAVAPVLYGSGIQIKVLEAFLTATPLVATSVALRGLDVRDGEQVLIADTPDEFSRAVMRLLADGSLRTRIGLAGRQYVEQHHNLKQTTVRLVSIYESVIQAYRQ